MIEDVTIPLTRRKFVFLAIDDRHLEHGICRSRLPRQRGPRRGAVWRGYSQKRLDTALPGHGPLGEFVSDQKAEYVAVPVKIFLSAVETDGGDR